MARKSQYTCFTQTVHCRKHQEQRGRAMLTARRHCSPSRLAANALLLLTLLLSATAAFAQNPTPPTISVDNSTVLEGQPFTLTITPAHSTDALSLSIDGVTTTPAATAAAPIRLPQPPTYVLNAAGSYVIPFTPTSYGQATISVTATANSFTSTAATLIVTVCHVELDIDTDYNNDNVVLYQGTDNCQAEIVGGTITGSFPITITPSPTPGKTASGNVTFNNGLTSLTLTLNGNASQTFTMYGQSKSQTDPNDVTLTPTYTPNGATTTPVCGDLQQVTVFWFDQGSTMFAAGNPYKLSSGSYIAVPNFADTVTATVLLKPPYVNANAGRILALQFGVQQNVLRENTTYTMVELGWHWQPSATKHFKQGDQFQITYTGTGTYTLGQLLDSASDADAPVSGRSASVSLVAAPTPSKASLPDNPGSSTATKQGFAGGFVIPYYVGNDLVLYVDYEATQAKVYEAFADWGVVYEKDPAIAPPASIVYRCPQTSWGLNNLQSGLQNQYATPMNSGAVTPINTPPTANSQNFGKISHTGSSTAIFYPQDNNNGN